MAPPTRLVIVACHAIFLGGDPLAEDNWLLAPFQKAGPDKPGEHATFVEHLLHGIRLADDTSVAVAVSGGSTRPADTPTSEARSYIAALRALGDDHDRSVTALCRQGRLLLEEDATDSYQNVLFSLLLFHRTYQAYPQHLTVVTHAFKAARFTELHARAIRWPRSKIDIAGIDPKMPWAEYQRTLDGERRFGFDAWQRDLYGTQSALAGKRRQRGWRGEDQLSWLAETDPQVRQLLFCTGGEAADVFAGPLPWAL